jgi:hypothetical protein
MPIRQSIASAHLLWAWPSLRRPVARTPPASAVFHSLVTRQTSLPVFSCSSSSYDGDKKTCRQPLRAPRDHAGTAPHSERAVCREGDADPLSLAATGRRRCSLLAMGLVMFHPTSTSLVLYGKTSGHQHVLANTGTQTRSLPKHHG